MDIDSMTDDERRYYEWLRAGMFVDITDEIRAALAADDEKGR